MELMPAKSWKLEFARSNEADRYREIMRRHHDDLRRKKDERERDDRNDALDALEVIAMATPEDVDAYLVTTAHYQEATYDAIIQNQQLLIDARRERQELFDRAYVLPNGRRVFESEDGIRVLDEFGVELDPSDISADEIPDYYPKYEEWKLENEAVINLEAERAELLEYQQKLDEAQERLEAGEITQKDFDAMKKDLAESMPDRVLANLPEQYRPEQEPEIEKQAALEIESAPLSRPGPMPGLGA